jgi:ribonuclease HI
MAIATEAPTLLEGGFDVDFHPGDKGGAWTWIGTDGVTLSGKVSVGTQLVTVARAVTALRASASHRYGDVLITAETSFTVKKLAEVALWRNGTLKKKRRHQDVSHMLSLLESGVFALQDTKDPTLRPLFRKAHLGASWVIGLAALGARSIPVPAKGDDLVIVTDGSYNDTLKTGVWCWVVSNECYGVGLIGKGSSTIIELTAIYNALVDVEPGAKITVLSDCQGVVSFLNSKKVSPCPNREEHELRLATRELVQNLGAKVQWVRGHNGHVLQTMADRRCRATLRAYLDNQGTQLLEQ